METSRENAYRCSGLGRADRGADLYTGRKRSPCIAGELVIRLQRLLIERTSSDHEFESR